MNYTLYVFLQVIQVWIIFCNAGITFSKFVDFKHSVYTFPLLHFNSIPKCSHFPLAKKVIHFCKSRFNHFIDLPSLGCQVDNQSIFPMISLWMLFLCQVYYVISHRRSFDSADLHSIYTPRPFGAISESASKGHMATEDPRYIINWLPWRDPSFRLAWQDTGTSICCISQGTTEGASEE